LSQKRIGDDLGLLDCAEDLRDVSNFVKLALCLFDLSKVHLETLRFRILGPAAPTAYEDLKNGREHRERFESARFRH